jgi:hypothetical protein
MPGSMTAEVCTQTSGYDLYFITTYAPNGGDKHVWSGALTSRFFPNEASAEWVVESPFENGGFPAIPAFSHATWTDPSWTDQYGSYTVFLDALGSFALEDKTCVSCGTQFVNPTSLSSNDTQFSEDYST